MHERLVVGIQMVDLLAYCAFGGLAVQSFERVNSGDAAVDLGVLCPCRTAVAMIHICPLLPGLEAGIGMFTLTPVPRDSIAAL
ncbi:hypothetical protein ACM9XD_03125 [Xanthomonas sacchari]